MVLLRVTGAKKPPARPEKTFGCLLVTPHIQYGGWVDVVVVNKLPGRCDGFFFLTCQVMLRDALEQLATPAFGGNGFCTQGLSTLRVYKAKQNLGKF